jgi:hypothetical protein
MSTIIIQGNLEENRKTVNVLKNHFPSVKVKASLPLENGNTTVLEANFESLHKEEYSAEEIYTALACCSDKVQRCATCPYVMEENCSSRLALDGAVLVQRLFQKSSK